MSITIRPKRLSGMYVPADGSQHDVPHRTETEAPESPVENREAPEWRSARQTEAPDAGEGRGHCLEQEFTHGRSQS